MPDHRNRDIYQEAFVPRDYLQQYYSRTSLPADDQQLFRIFSTWLRDRNRFFEHAIDIGCGPTMHNSFALTRFVGRIDLADYLPQNLLEIAKWRDGLTEAHDWKHHFRGVLECSGDDANLLRERIEEYRAKLDSLRRCDLCREGIWIPRDESDVLDGLNGKSPGMLPPNYDLVTSFFCAECITQDTKVKTNWRSIISRIGSLVKDSGALFMAACRDCHRYRVLGEWFPVTPVDESDFEELLPSLGFINVQTWVVDAPDWADDGFDQIVLVAAEKEVR
jgi:hypothetical protein